MTINLALHFIPVTGCDNLLSPANGRVDVSGTTVGSTATYSCDTGYELDGERVRVCQPSGEWTGLEPFCKRKLEKPCSYNMPI